MGLDLLQMRTDLRVHTGEDDQDLPDAAANLLLNKSWWEVMDKFPLREKERTASFDMATGERIYTMPVPHEAIQVLGMEDPDDNRWKKFRRMTPEWYQQNYVAGSDMRAKPERYMRRENGYWLYPTPDYAYTGIIWYWTMLEDLVADTDEPDAPQVWHEIIMFGGAYRRLLELGDYVRARELKSYQASFINTLSSVEAKEESDTHLGGIELPEEMFDDMTIL